MRTTLADAKCSRIPQVLNLSRNDPRLLSYINEAQQRLLIRGKWWGTYAKFRMCATDGCITFPRQIATLETAAVCGVPVPVHDLWYEFLENGYGLRGNNSQSESSSTSSGGCGSNACGMAEALYRGNYPTFDDIRGTTKKLRFVCDRSSDVLKSVLALGYDGASPPNWIRTNQDGIIKDGELISLAQSPGTNSVNVFSQVTDLQLPCNLDGQVWLYEYDPDTNVQRMIGHYEYDDIRPSYARYYFPSIRAAADCSKQTPVDVIAKLDFIPVKNDTDYLIIGNLAALKMECMAVKKYEEANNVSDMNEAAGFELMAVGILNSELDHHLGAGRQIGINIIGSSIGFRADPVETLL